MSYVHYNINKDVILILVRLKTNFKPFDDLFGPNLLKFYLIYNVFCLKENVTYEVGGIGWR